MFRVPIFDHEFVAKNTCISVFGLFVSATLDLDPKTCLLEMYSGFISQFLDVGISASKGLVSPRMWFQARL